MDRHEEAKILKSLADSYQEIINESAKGKLGGDVGDTMRGARAAQGGGRLGVFTPARGMGAKKNIKNDPKADDKRAKKQKDQAREDRKAEARERARRGEDKYSKAIKSVQDED